MKLTIVSDGTAEGTHLVDENGNAIEGVLAASVTESGALALTLDAANSSAFGLADIAALLVKPEPQSDADEPSTPAKKK